MAAVGDKHPEYESLSEAWHLPLSLMGGTRAMREARAKYLPQWPKETLAAYDLRVSSSTLYNAFKRTVRTLSAKPFQRDVQVVDAPPDLEILLTDADRQRRTLTQFARRQLWDLLTFGPSYFLVDMPQFAPGLTRAAQLEQNIHPYFARVRPDEIINWEFTPDATGMEALTELHIYRCKKVRDNKLEERITVWRPAAVEFYVRTVDRPGISTADVPYLEEPGRPPIPNPLGLIPLVDTYADVSFNGRMHATCPLEDLAFLNLRHYQSQSDQDTALHYARVPFLLFAGFNANDIEQTLAANNAYASSNPAAKIEWVEPTGSALEQGFKDLDRLEARMDVFGAELLVQRPGNETATAKVLDAGEKVSDLQSMVISLETALERGYELAAKWLGLPAAPVQITLFRDFGLSLKDAKEIDALLKARLQGDISRETFLNELSRRGLIDDLDPEEEKKRLAGEGAFDDDTQLQEPRAGGA